MSLADCNGVQSSSRSPIVREFQRLLEKFRKPLDINGLHRHAGAIAFGPSQKRLALLLSYSLTWG